MVEHGSAGQKITSLYANSRASITALGALASFSLISMAAISVELGYAYTSRVNNQAIADASALAGALAYMNNGNEAAAFQKAKDVALAANIPSTGVTASLVSSPRNASLRAMQVVVNTSQPLFLARIFGRTAPISISATAKAEISTSDTACIIALGSSGTPVSVVAGSSIAATDCSVGSNGGMSLSTSSTITAKSVLSGGTVSTVAGSSITTTPAAGNIRQNVPNAVKDPFSGNAALNAEFAKIGTGPAPSAAPSPPSGTLAAQPLPNLGPFGCTSPCSFQGKSLTKIGDTWYAPAGVYNITSINMWNIKLVFEGTSSNPTTLYISGPIDVDSSTLTIQDGNIYSKGTLNPKVSGFVNIGNGRHYFESINGVAGTQTVIGDGDLDVMNDVTMQTSSNLTVGNGAKKIGGNISAAADGRVRLGNGQLSVRGEVSIATRAEFTVGTATEHYINGNLNTAASSKINLGAARYYISGSVGGSTAATFTGNGVNIIASGALNLAAGSSSLLKPPTADGTTAISNILFASKTTAASTFSTSSSADISGTLYLPNSTMSVIAGSSLGSTTQCLLLVTSQISVSTGASIKTKCSNLSDDFKNASNISLVQ